MSSSRHPSLATPPNVLSNLEQGAHGHQKDNRTGNGRAEGWLIFEMIVC